MHVPINAITWTLGCIALYTFGLKSWRTHRLTKNPLARMYYVLGAAFGTALFFFGVPGLVTQNAHILRYTYFTADFFVQLSMQVQVWILWFLGLKGRVQLKRLYWITVPLSLLSMTWEVLTSQVSVSRSPYLIVYTDKFPVLLIKSIIYVAIAMPLGYFFLRQVPRQANLSAKTKSLTAGLTFIVVCLVATSENIFDKGSDTPASSRAVAAFFVFFLLVQVVTAIRPSKRY